MIARRVRRVVEGHRRRRGTPSQNFSGTSSVSSTQTVADLVGQIRQGERGERVPGEWHIGPGRGANGMSDVVHEPTEIVVPEPLDESRRGRRVPHRLFGERPQHVGDDLTHDRATVGGDPLSVEPSPAIAVDQRREESMTLRPPSPHVIELRRRVETRLVGLDQPEKVVALEIRDAPASTRGARRCAAPAPDRRPRSTTPTRAVAAGSCSCSGRGEWRRCTESPVRD